MLKHSIMCVNTGHPNKSQVKNILPGVFKITDSWYIYLHNIFNHVCIALKENVNATAKWNNKNQETICNNASTQFTTY